MKKSIAVIMAAIALAATPVQAGLFDSMATSGWPNKVPEQKYTLDVYGFDVRVYEWTPKEDKNARCTAMFSQSGPVGIQCWKKTDK